MTETKGKSKTSNGEGFFETYEQVLKQKKVIDNLVYKMERRLVRFVQNSHKKVKGKRKSYVARVKNETTLIKAIRKVMASGEEMNMEEVQQGLLKLGHRTNSDKGYTMVNNKIREDTGHIKRVRRGVYKLRIRKKRVKDKASEVAA